MADTKTAAAPKAAAEPKGDPSHIRFIGYPSDDEHSSTEVFGKRFYRGKWVPLSNLDGGNPEKKALPEAQLKKLLHNPAFQLGHGEDTPVPGMGGDDPDKPSAEEA